MEDLSPSLIPSNREILGIQIETSVGVSFLLPLEVVEQKRVAFELQLVVWLSL
jgi:hypothetical protein